MRRREFIAMLGGAVTAWAFPVHAQQPAMPVIGFLGAVSLDGFTERVRAFRQGLKDTGYVEGENVAIESRWAENQLDRLPALTTDLIPKQVAVIVAAGGTTPAIAAKAATTTIPIVFVIPEDPAQLGLVASLSRPGGNVTGVNFFFGEVVPKRLELLRELVPTMSRVAAFVNPANPARAESLVREAESTGRAMGLHIQIFNTGTGREINAAFAAIAGQRPDALLVLQDAVTLQQRKEIVDFAIQKRLPGMFQAKGWAEAGGLMSYGEDLPYLYWRAASFVDKIFKGANPADLPVEQATKFELVLNLKTARAIGLTIPDAFLALADEVIE